jgi:hypothetical protein
MITHAMLIAPVMMLAGCVAAPVDVATLAGEWHGRIVTARGQTAAHLTLGVDGHYAGTAFFDDLKQPLRGAIVALPSGHLRYVGTEGDGTVDVDEGGLRFRGDDGATGGRFRRTGHP